MQELRFVAVSEDGQYAVLGVPGRSARFTLPIDERLRAVALGQTSRLVQYEIEVESPLRPKEIQARIRAGETVEEIADAAGIAVERVRWFEGPVLAERAYVADQAQKASVRRQGDATPGPRLGEIVAERLKVFGADPDDPQWDAKKRGDGSWLVQLAFITGGRLHTAEWVFDPRRRHVLPADDNAARMSLPGTEPPPASPGLTPAAPPPGEATVTHLAPRLSTSSGHGPGGMGNSTVASAAHGSSAIGNGLGNGSGSGGRPRQEWPGSTRPGVPEPKVADREAAQIREPQPREYESREAEAPAAATAGSAARANGCARAARAAGSGLAGRSGRSGRPGGTSGRDGRARPGGSRRRAGDAAGPEGGARPTVLGAVLGRDHVRQLAPARLARRCPAGCDSITSPAPAWRSSARSRETSVCSALPGLPGGSSGQSCPASVPAETTRPAFRASKVSNIRNWRPPTWTGRPVSSRT